MRYIALVTLLILAILVSTRALQLRSLGIKAVRIGEIDKKDFLILPLVPLLFYAVAASVFDLPRPWSEWFSNTLVAWIGTILCALGIALFAYAIVSFGKSFRIGLDEDKPGKLVTTGAFSISRNPIYVALELIFIGLFLILPSWIFLLYVVGGVLLFRRQILIEEKSLKKIYGDEYIAYCKRVRRFL